MGCVSLEVEELTIVLDDVVRMLSPEATGVLAIHDLFSRLH